MRPCLDCHTPTNRTRCPTCQRKRDAQRNAQRTHYQGDWAARSRAARHAHLEQHGPTCPGWDTPPHTVHPTDLTADHLHPADPTSPIRILCRSCNSRRGDRPDPT